MKRIALLLVIMVAIASLLVAGCGGVGESPSDVVKGHIEAVEQGDYSEARSYLASDALVTFTTTQFQGAMQWISEQGGIKKIVITEENVRGEFADVYFEFEFKNGQTYNDTAHLVKEKGEWKIQLSE